MKKDFRKETMEKIKKENIRVKPSSYFRLLKIALHILIVFLSFLVVYAFNLVFYLPKRITAKTDYDSLFDFLALVPWPLLLVGSISIGLLVYLYRNYKGGYKKQLGLTIVIVFGIALAAGAMAAKSNLNERLEKRPNMNRLYQWQEERLVPEESRRRYRKFKNQPKDSPHQNGQIRK